VIEKGSRSNSEHQSYESSISSDSSEADRVRGIPLKFSEAVMDKIVEHKDDGSFGGVTARLDSARWNIGAISATFLNAQAEARALATEAQRQLEFEIERQKKEEGDDILKNERDDKEQINRSDLKANSKGSIRAATSCYENKSVKMTLQNPIPRLKVPNLHGIIGWEKEFAQPAVEWSSTFEIENEFSVFDDEGYKIDHYDNLYVQEIVKHGYLHTNWLGLIPDDEPGKREHIIVSVLNEPNFDRMYPIIVNSKEGFKNFTLPLSSVKIGKKGELKVEQAIIEWLEARFPKANWAQIRESAAFMKELETLEIKHGVKRNTFSIAAIYAQTGQFHPFDMFQNQPTDFSEPAKTFFKLMEITNEHEPTEVDRANEKLVDWYGRIISWHCAPFMNSEQIRRLVGNDNAVLIFVDEGTQFNPIFTSEFGGMPQIFVVVQPHEDAYRVGFYSKKKILPFGPALMKGFLCSKEDLKDFVLTKLHNGLLMSLLCPPLSALRTRPRQAAMLEVVEKHIAKSKTFLFDVPKKKKKI